jgi:hypothetical protein
MGSGLSLTGWRNEHEPNLHRQTLTPAARIKRLVTSSNDSKRRRRRLVLCEATLLSAPAEY